MVLALLDANGVADLLEEIADRLELTGESTFKVRAYRNSADLLRELREPLADLVSSRRLMKLPGIGEAIAEKISSLHKKGTHPTLERLRADVPDGMLEIFRIPGLGPKKVLQLRDTLGIEDLDALERAARADKLITLKGFTPKLQAKVLESIGFVRASAKRILIIEADYHTQECIRNLRQDPAFLRAEATGETRRRCETIGDPTVLAALKPGKAPAGDAAEARVRLAVCPPEQFGTKMLFETGAPAFVEAMLRHAEKQGAKLAPEGVRLKSGPVDTPTEERVFQALGIPFVPPELREDAAALERALTGQQPELIDEKDMKGILHSHTTFSDGQASLEGMCEAVRALGLGYYGVCDHSQSAAYAGGMKEEKVNAQHAEADLLNENYAKKGQPFRVFKGIESDIKEDGSLDYPDEVLKRFDFIVASVHSRFDLDEKSQTARVVKAVQNPYTTILGHMTGRLLLRRTGYKLDVERVLEACAANGVAVEINAHPVRLDVDWRWHARAKELGCLVSINPDAHTIPEIEHYRFGVAVARKGGLAAKDNLTSLDAEALAKHFSARKARS